MRRSLFITCLMTGKFFYAQEVQLVTVGSGFTAPTDLESSGDARIFVVERAGLIKIMGQDGTTLAEPFLDITDRVNSTGGEQGLLGMAFHPQYASNGFFYVNYIHGSGNGTTRISRFTVTTDADLADPTSELIIWSTAQLGTNHNGGDLAFGPDGYL
ncbi:MAG: PQQ-dependent sugar dehydrogenase, partial [Bacteroidota bacterium]|nr:PQQ-dependent sugar dehydrogenase [Bacteroidota bacterium]